MIDHLRNTQSLGLEDLEVLVLDEADRLLEMGFADEVGGWLVWGVVFVAYCLWASTHTTRTWRFDL